MQKDGAHAIGTMRPTQITQMARYGTGGRLCVAVAAQEQQPLPSDALFNSEVVQRIDLRMNSMDWEKLKANFQENTYYPADLVFEGQTVRNTGVRSRGAGSRSGIKPGLRVDFDRYATDQTFLGLEGARPRQPDAGSVSRP